MVCTDTARFRPCQEPYQMTVVPSQEVGVYDHYGVMRQELLKNDVNAGYSVLAKELYMSAEYSPKGPV